MARFKKIYRKEHGQWLLLGSAVLYIKDEEGWRETTKMEADIFEIHHDPLTFLSAVIPSADDRRDGDYYVLLYPDWDGEVWDGAQSDSKRI